jgi:phosphatidylinositol glycan class C protein
MAASPRRRRVLYESTVATRGIGGDDGDDDDGRRMTVADNYTDPETFLSRMRLNERVRVRSYAASAVTAWTISQQCAVAAIHAGTHAAIDRGGEEVLRRTRAWSAAALCAGLCGWVVFGREGSGGDGTRAPIWWRIRRSVRLGALTVGGLTALTPLCQTMTAAVSTDTATTCAVIALISYAITYDYAFVNLETKQLASSFSLAAAMFATMLMASRLEDPRAVFLDVLVALECYVLSPYVWRAIRAFNSALHLTVVFAMHALAYHIVRDANPRLASAYLFGIALLGVVTPAVLVEYVASGKTQIAGPWDEALPSLHLFKDTVRASGVPRYRHWAANDASMDAKRAARRR